MYKHRATLSIEWNLNKSYASIGPNKTVDEIIKFFIFQWKMSTQSVQEMYFLMKFQFWSKFSRENLFIHVSKWNVEEFGVMIQNSSLMTFQIIFERNSPHYEMPNCSSRSHWQNNSGKWLMQHLLFLIQTLNHFQHELSIANMNLSLNRIKLLGNKNLIVLYATIESRTKK